MSTAVSNCTVAATAAPIVSPLTVLTVMRQALTSDRGYASNTSAGNAASGWWAFGDAEQLHIRDPMDVHESRQGHQRCNKTYGSSTCTEEGVWFCTADGDSSTLVFASKIKLGKAVPVSPKIVLEPLD